MFWVKKRPVNPDDSAKFRQKRPVFTPFYALLRLRDPPARGRYGGREAGGGGRRNGLVRFSAFKKARKNGFGRFRSVCERGEEKLQEPSVQHPERPAETASPTRQAVERSRNVIEIGRKFASGSPLVRIIFNYFFAGRSAARLGLKDSIS